MRKDRPSLYILNAVAGLVIVLIGIVILLLLKEPKGIFESLPFVCIGVGSGIFGGSMGTIIKNKKITNDPKLARQIEINLKDERNQIIDDKAKARAYDLMIYVYAAMLLVFALLHVNTFVILTLVAVYLFFIFAKLCCLVKYHKEM
jgi:hypothetical protein